MQRIVVDLRLPVLQAAGEPEVEQRQLVAGAEDDVLGFHVAVDDALAVEMRQGIGDLGLWKYEYNNFGDLVSQTDAIGATTTMSYDRLGRLVSKTDGTGATSGWVYDVGSGAAKGKLSAMVGPPSSVLTAGCTVPSTVPNNLPTDGNRAAKWFTYTPFGDVSEEFDRVDGETFATSYVYDDAHGRPISMTYPGVNGSRFSVGYNYTSTGFLQYVTDGDSGSVYWQAKTVDARGQIVTEELGNGVETVKNRSNGPGWVLGSVSTAHADGGTVIQDWGYRFDEAGNLRKRFRRDKVNVADSEEIFGYDALDRLTSAETKINYPSQTVDSTEPYVYDNLGNMTHKGDKTYTYGGCQNGGFHAVCAINDGVPFQYDPNGNMLAGGDRTLTYTPDNKVKHIDSHPSPSVGNDTGTVDFAYGADGNRVVQVASGGTSATTAKTIYVGLGGTGKSSYERTKIGTGSQVTTQHVHFLYAGAAHGGSAFAVRTMTAGSNAPVTTYNHFDHLGSVTAVSDEIGHVVDPLRDGPNAGVLGYDPWGVRRNPEGTAGNPAYFNPPPGHREFTGHETIPNVGLVNMNGRVYDTALGRFLSPDPTVQFVTDLQSYNRYSYALNNPLRYSDPTGYSITGSNDLDGFIGFAAGIAVTVGCGGDPVCSFALGAGVAWWGIMSAVSSDVPFEQALLGAGVNFGAGQVGGAIAGDSPMNMLIGGAVAGAINRAYYDASSGHAFGWDILEAAQRGAASSAFAWTAAKGVGGALSWATAAQAQGGGGSGAARVERAETVESVIADAGGRQVSDVEWYMATGVGGDRRVALVDVNYNTATGELTVMDWDTGEYLVTRAESGGKPWGDPIPKGEYEILARAKEPKFRLDAVDASPRNDRNDNAGGRDVFRLHGPGYTKGCIACVDAADWQRVFNLIYDTRTTTVPDMATYHWWQTPSGAPILKYGQLNVE